MRIDVSEIRNVCKTGTFERGIRERIAIGIRAGIGECYAMKKPFRTLTFLFTSFLLVIGGLSLVCFLWVKREQQQYVQNRQLIQALDDQEYKRAIALVNSGADPNTLIFPLPAPSFAKLVKQRFHREPPGDDKDTAFLVAFGSGRVVQAADYKDFIRLARVMIAHGANVNVTDSSMGQTCLMSAIDFGRTDLMILLLQHGANIWVQDCYGDTALSHANRSIQPNADDVLVKYFAAVKR